MSELITVAVGADTYPVQIDDFPEGCERSCKGAVHFRPGALLQITAAELAHVQAKHAGLAATLRVSVSSPVVDVPLRPIAPPMPYPDLKTKAAPAEEKEKASSNKKL